MSNIVRAGMVTSTRSAGIDKFRIDHLQSTGHAYPANVQSAIFAHWDLIFAILHGYESTIKPAVQTSRSITTCVKREPSRNLNAGEVKVEET
jgi:hypothetical protein